MNKYHLATFGCQMNVYDSNLLAAMLEKRGLSATESPADADVVLVNTCSIRGGAEDRAYARIASMRHHKRLNPKMKIAVVGCMAQNHGEKIPVSLEHVDFVVGPDSYQDLEKKLFSSSRPEPQILTEINPFENYAGLEAKVASGISTHVTIMRGCNKHCAYCIVPYVRGKEKSRNPDEILQEISHAVDQGIKEVCLLGQTVNSYKTPDVNFAKLLRLVNEIDGLKRIRFTSPHPKHFDESAIRAMAECEKVCRHVHLPLQSGSDRILKKMRRQYTRQKYLDIVKALREAMPGIGITTDIITGFVSEEEADFEQTLSLVEEIGFDSAFMFSYSPREGTSAFSEAETLSESQKQKRLERLIEIQLKITEKKLNSMIGKEETILIEGPSFKNDKEFLGKTSCFKKVILPESSGVNSGDEVKARIRERRGQTLRGEKLYSLKESSRALHQKSKVLVERMAGR